VKYDRGEEPGAEGSLDKLYWSESFQRVADLVLQVEGKEAVAVPRDQAEKLPPAFERYLYSRGRTIAAGTSEIQRMIVAQRILGLPR
jgi:alkylation response protein AidB-like acyl-CoA dehydrogenase